MDKETLSNYGWIVILVLILAVMLALATPFGNFVAGAIKATTAGFFSVNQEAMGVAGITIPGQNFEEDNAKPIPNELIRGIYKEGDYIYFREIISGNEYGAKTLDDLEEAKELMKKEYEENWGMPWDEILIEVKAEAEFFEDMTWDEFVDMEGFNGYTVEEYIFAKNNLSEEHFVPTVYANEWSVKLNLDVTDTKQTSYGPILSYIDGAPVTRLSYYDDDEMDFVGTFRGCTALINAPQIPNTITDLSNTFMDCTALTSAPTIPDSVTNMYGTFAGCESLVAPPAIPDSVTNMQGTFWKCTSLETAPVIPDNVTDLKWTFYDCKKFVDLSTFTIPSGVTDLDSTFAGCENLKVAPQIPNGVTEMECTFYGCKKLQYPPQLPNSVTNLDRTFVNCTSLTDLSDFVIPRSVTYMYSTFKDCTSLTAITEGAGWGNNVFDGTPFEGGE